MSRKNPLWGAPGSKGELLKLGIEISEATVSKYPTRFPKPPSQKWRTFLDNHSKALASIDFFDLPTATFRLLMVLIVLHHERRQSVHFGVTAHPTAAWVVGNRVGCHRRDGPLLGMIHRALAPDRGEPRLLRPRPARRAIIVV